MQLLDSFCFLATTQFLASPSVGSDADTFWLWIRVLAFLGLLGAGAYFLTHYNRGRRIRSTLSGEEKIIVADTCSLGNKQFLVVAQYGVEKHLIGVSPSSISYLSRLSSDNNDFQQKLNEVESMDKEEQDA